MVQGFTFVFETSDCEAVLVTFCGVKRLFDKTLGHTLCAKTSLFFTRRATTQIVERSCGTNLRQNRISDFVTFLALFLTADTRPRCSISDFGLFAAIGALAASALQELWATLKDGPIRPLANRSKCCGRRPLFDQVLSCADAVKGPLGVDFGQKVSHELLHDSDPPGGDVLRGWGVQRLCNPKKLGFKMI